MVPKTEGVLNFAFFVCASFTSKNYIRSTNTLRELLNKEKLLTCTKLYSYPFQSFEDCFSEDHVRG